jgi:RNA polymerase sigma-70 factor, ECF subfamily
MPMSDDDRPLADLIRRAQNGDDEAVDQLLADYRPFLRLVADQALGQLLRRREDASDIVQQTEMEAYRAIGDFRGSSEPEFSAWIKQILRRNVSNLIRDNWAAKRDQRREKYLDNSDNSVSLTWMSPQGGAVSSPSQHVVRAEVALQLAKALEELPESQRTAVRMRHLQGCGLDEIAAAMDKTPPAVAGLIRRGLQALREGMGGDTSWI